MNYPLPDFLSDYQTWLGQDDSWIGIQTSRYAEGLKAFFQRRYRENLDLSDYRCRHFRSIVDWLCAHQTELVNDGLIRPRPATALARFPANLLATVHGLMLLEGVASPTLEQVRESAKKYG